MNIEVKPQGREWVVTKNGVTVSNHRKKQRATNTARSMAGPGDRLVIHRSDGTFQNHTSY